MPEKSKVKLSKTEKDKIIKQFMDDFDLAFTAESRNRVDQVDDLRFAALDQWPDEVKATRKDRPMLTLDHIGQPVRKILGSMRQNMPSIKVDPVDDGADKETADVLEDLVRQIEQDSGASGVYMNAAKPQVKCGYGVWRVNTIENTEDIFNQDIVIQSILNPFTCYFDPDAVMPQKQDGRFVIVSDTLSRERFKAEFGKDVPEGHKFTTPVSIPNKGIGETMTRWYDTDSVRVGEYFQKTKEPRTLVQLSNGVVLNKDEITDEDIALYREQGIQPVNEREVKADVINWYKLTAFDILEHIKWPVPLFPIIPVYGEQENIEGETFIRGIVRAAKDPQRMYNYWNSAAAELIALQPKAPWVLTKDQIKNYKQFWDQANTANLPYLVYEPDGTAPPPQRSEPPTMQNGLLQQAQTSAVDIQQATGVFEASTGDLPQQRSGRAVIALQQEANVSTSEFEDNLAKAIEHTGKVIISLIPKYYDTQRIVRLRGEDDVVRFVEVNKPILTPDGKQIQNDLTRGKYDVRASAGPGFKTRRIEAASSMVELARVFPQILQVAGDLVAKNLDWPGADELAERLRKVLPPGLVEEEDEEKRVQMEQAAQQQQQLQQQAAQLEFQGKQADTDKTKSETLKNLTEAKQNDIENLVSMAETAIEAQNEGLAVSALNQITQLLANQPQQQPVQQQIPQQIAQ